METQYTDDDAVIVSTNTSIYKVFKYDYSGKIADVYIFSGGVNEYFNPESGKSDELTTHVFNQQQIDYIEMEGVNVHYSNLIIHPDDSIQTVKKKIIMEFGVKSVTYDEIYMFMKTHKPIRVEDIVGMAEISPVDFAQLLENFNIPLHIIQGVEKKDAYTVSDIVNLNIVDLTTTVVDTCLGQKFLDYFNCLFSGNPFKLITPTAVKTVSLENQLLLNYDDVINNEIYVCLANDVFSYFENGENPRITSEYLSSTYFPFLYNSGVTDKQSLSSVKPSLILYNDSFITNYNNYCYSVIDTFRKIYYQRKTDLLYISNGVRSITMFIKRQETVQISLENLFKLIHTDADTPLILYNPGFKKDSVVRLYCKKVSTDGKKIPVMSESVINKIIKEINKSNRMVVYSVSSEFTIHIGVDSGSNIYVSGVSNKEMSVDEWNGVIKTAVNAFIEKINKMMNYTGYSIPYIVGLTDDTIYSMDLHYSLSISISKEVSLLSTLPCLTTIFDIETDSLSSGKMKFKRVENYKEMNEIQTFIRVSINNLKTPYEVVESLMERFGLAKMDAIDRYTEYIDEHQQIQGKQVDNPGFNIVMSVIPMDKTLVINVFNITSVKYISEIFIYLDSLIRIIQHPTTTHIPITEIEKICRLPYSAKTNADADTSIKQNVVSSKESQLTKTLPTTQIKPLLFQNSSIFAEDGDKDQDDDDSGGFIIDYDYDYNIDNIDDDDDDDGGFIIDEDEDDVAAEDEYGDNEEEDDDGGFIIDDEEDEDDGNAPGEKGGAEPVSGGNNSNSNNDDIKLNGFRIKNPSYFFTRIKKREPQLILSKKDGKYDAYARACPANLNKQPVILTDEEKRHIDETSPGSYNHALKYGTDKNNPNWYICPRYWCLKTNTSMTKEQVDSGVCGGIIPQNAKTVPNGKYVYEFTSNKHIDSEGNYIEHTPGFLKEDSHPKYFLPCCFSRSWDSHTQKQRREQYSKTITDDSDADQSAKPGVLSKKGDGNSLYVISFDVYPLQRRRWGFLPICAQKFLEINYSSIIHNMHYIKSGTPCFLRFGVENTNTQSFVGCISELYAYKWGLSVSPSVAEMKQILASSITLDGYIRYHNGSLVSIFRPSVVDFENINLKLYSGTNFFSTIDLADKVQLNFLENTVASFENFKKFLVEDESVIDHTYLWDIVTDNNVNLIKGGCNLVILNVPNDDITDNIEMVCPSNSYSSNKYNVSLETFILIKQDGFYEPIFMYEERKNIVNYRKTFLYDSSPPPILRLLEIIEKTTDKYCSPIILKKHKMYKFVKNMDATSLIDKLINNGYTVYKQVLNYQSKTIGVVIGKIIIGSYSSKKELLKNAIFLPCLPSSVILAIDAVYMDDPSIWCDYRTTLQRFNELKHESDGEILCSITCKVVDDGIVVGFLTETNQFVQITPPVILEETFNDELEIINSSNYNSVDIAAATSSAIDIQRETEITKISLESNFYYAFRVMVRGLLNKYDNIDLRNRILLMLTDARQGYNAKLTTVKNFIRILISQTIVFSEFDMSYITDIGNLKNKCGEVDIGVNPDTNYCFLRSVPDKPTTQLIVPKLNLISGLDNESIYVLRIADEIIRYKRIQLFMFNPAIHLNSAKNHYSINKDELLILLPLLNSDYFKNLVEYNTSTKIENLVYDTAEPQGIAADNYRTTVKLDEQNQMLDVVDGKRNRAVGSANLDCVGDIRKVIGNKQNSIWARIFPASVSEIIFKPSPFCSFEIAMRILQQYTNVNVTVQYVKQYLCSMYHKFMPKYNSKIIKILRNQGKRDISKRLGRENATIDSIVFSDDYYLTDLDLWMIFEGSKIPVIVFYSTSCKTMVMNTNWIYLNGGEMVDTIYAPIHFIRSPVNINANEPYSYHLISDPLLFRDLGEFSEEVERAIELRNNGGEKGSANIQSLENFLQNINFIKPK